MRTLKYISTEVLHFKDISCASYHSSNNDIIVTIDLKLRLRITYNIRNMRFIPTINQPYLQFKNEERIYYKLGNSFKVFIFESMLDGPLNLHNNHINFEGIMNDQRNEIKVYNRLHEEGRNGYKNKSVEIERMLQNYKYFHGIKHNGQLYLQDYIQE